MPAYPYLKIDHVDKSFMRGSTETEVLKDITLGIEKGEYVSIIGHSGCGKSTLLNLVAGLLPVSAGCVLLENQEVNDPGPRPRRGVPEPLAAAVAHRLRQREDRGRQGVLRRPSRSRSATTGSCTTSISCRWRTPRTSGRRRSPAA